MTPTQWCQSFAKPPPASPGAPAWQKIGTIGWGSYCPYRVLEKTPGFEEPLLLPQQPASPPTHLLYVQYLYSLKNPGFQKPGFSEPIKNQDFQSKNPGFQKPGFSKVFKKKTRVFKEPGFSAPIVPNFTYILYFFLCKNTIP